MMAGVLSREHRYANSERGFEFSRLAKEWMAAAYALVVQPGQRGGRPQPTTGTACGPAKAAEQARLHQRGGKVV